MGKKWTRDQIEEIARDTFEPWEWKESRIRNIARHEAQALKERYEWTEGRLRQIARHEARQVGGGISENRARNLINHIINNRVASKARDGGNRELRNFIRAKAGEFQERWEWTENRLRQIARQEAGGVAPGEVRNIANDVVNDRIASKVRDGGNRELRNYIEAIGDDEGWGEYPEFQALIAKAIEAVSEMIEDMNLVEKAEVTGIIDDAINDRVAEAARDGGGNEELRRFIRDTANAYLERYEWRGQTIRDMIQEEISKAGGISEQRAKELATETVNQQVASAAGGEAENSPLIEFLGGLAETIGEWLNIDIPLTEQELENWISNLIEDTLEYLGELDVEQEGGSTGESQVTSQPEAGGDEWPGLVNLIPDIELLRLEHIDFPFHCKIGLFGIGIDICDLIAAPIEMTVNLVIDAFNFVVNDIPDILVDWAAQFIRDVADTFVALPPPFEQASDAFIDYVIFGEKAARLRLTNEIRGAIRSEVNDAVRELGISPRDIKDTADQIAWGYLKQFGIEPPERTPDMREVIHNFLETQELTGRQIGSRIKSGVQYTLSDMGFIAPPEVEGHASFHVPYDEYLCSKCWLQDMPCPETTVIPEDAYSLVVNKILPLSEDDMAKLMDIPREQGYFTQEGCNTAFAVLDLTNDAFDLTAEQICVFRLAVVPQIIDKASEMRQAIKAFVFDGLDYWTQIVEDKEKTPWPEIYKETADILQAIVGAGVEISPEAVKEVLEELGYTKVPDMEEAIDTTEEAIGAFKALEQMLTDVEQVDPEDIEGLKGPVAKLVDALQTIAPQEEEEAE